MARRLFVAVATGQNVANLPPILELAQPGDMVVWLESRQAKEGKWTKGANNVLARRNLDIGEPASISEINNPAEVSHACHTLLSRPDLPQEIYVVTNGGTKLTLIGLYSGFYEARATFLYGSDRPVELWVFPEAFQGTPQRRIYEVCNLDLADVVEVAGYQLCKEPTLIWPSLSSQSLYAKAPDQGYLFECQVANRVYEWLCKTNGYGIIGSAWMNITIAKKEGDMTQDDQGGDKRKKGKKKKKSFGEAIAEWDVVLLLKNGILVNLECKTGHTEGRKELWARIAIMQRATSQLAQMVLCRPYDFSEPSAQQNYHVREQNCRRLGIPHFPVCTENPPPGVPSFEESLQKFIAPYCP